MTMLGKHHSEQSKKRIGNAQKGTKKPWAGKYKRTREMIENYRKANLGKHHSPKTEFKKGHKTSKETKNKISNCLLRRFSGDKNPSWKGGLSFEPYSVDWTKTLKRAVKERDHYICQICEIQDDLVVHHIDCNKKNCDMNNLITICRKCHSKIHKGWTEEDLKNLKK